MAALVDTFTDTNGVDLDAHTSDSGHSWTKHAGEGTGVIEIQGNFAVSSVVSQGCYYTSSYSPPSADYSLRVVFNSESLVAMAIAVGIRCETDGDGLFLQSEGFTDTLALIEIVGGSENVLDSAANATGTNEVEVSVVGDQAEWFLGGVSQGTETVSGSLSAAGLVGFSAFSGGNTALDIAVVEIEVTEAGGAAGPSQRFMWMP